MGFYAPAQLVADAKKHNVDVLPVDVNHSDWDCTIEENANREKALRLGLRMVSGLRTETAATIEEARKTGRFTSISEFTQRTRLSQTTIARLSQADTFGSLNQSRRAALWQALAQEKKPKAQPLFAALEVEDNDTRALPELAAQDQVTDCLLYTSPSPRDRTRSRMPSSA